MLSNAFAIVGLLAGGYWLSIQTSTNLYQATELRRLARDLQSVPAAGPPKPARPVAPPIGSVIGKLEIPRLGVSTVVVEGAGENELRIAPGHVTGTALPGSTGNIALAGHRDTFFRPLRDIRTNDTIRLTTRDGQFSYRVISTELTVPQDVQVLYPTSRPTLTLITCYPFTFIGAAPKRFIVRASLLPSSA